jgi:AbiV family abortive infection protein
MRIQEFLRKLRSGTLTVDEIGRGMHKSFVNARELIEDAETLLQKRPGRAISLAILAIEEIAKVVLLANAAVRTLRGPVDWNAVQEELNLRSHRDKLTIFAIYGRALLDRMDAKGEKNPFYEYQLPAGIAPLLDLLKQLGFYVDVGDGRFMSPNEFGETNREWADWLITVARERLESFEPLHATEEQSMALAHGVVALATAVGKSKDEAQLKKEILEFTRKQIGTKSLH